MAIALLTIAAFSVEGIIARGLVGFLAGVMAYYFAKRWDQQRSGVIGIWCCTAGGLLLGLWGALSVMTVMLIYLDSVRRVADKARRALRLFRVGERNWGVNVSRSTCRIDRKGGQPRLSLEVHGDETLSAGEEVSLTVHDAPATEVDGMVEARLGGKGPTASAVLHCAGGRSVEDLCVRLRSDGGVEVFGVAMIQNERQPLRVNWTIQKTRSKAERSDSGRNG